MYSFYIASIHFHWLPIKALSPHCVVAWYFYNQLSDKYVDLSNLFYRFFRILTGIAIQYFIKPILHHYWCYCTTVVWTRFLEKIARFCRDVTRHSYEIEKPYGSRNVDQVSRPLLLRNSQDKHKTNARQTHANSHVDTIGGPVNWIVLISSVMRMWHGSWMIVAKRTSWSFLFLNKRPLPYEYRSG